MGGLWYGLLFVLCKNLPCSAPLLQGNRQQRHHLRKTHGSGHSAKQRNGEVPKVKNMPLGYRTVSVPAGRGGFGNEPYRYPEQSPLLNETINTAVRVCWAKIREETRSSARDKSRKRTRQPEPQCSGCADDADFSSLRPRPISRAFSAGSARI
jgi:hypothetical protein